MTDLHSIPVREFVFLNIKLKATCRSCGRQRIIEGGLLRAISRPMPASILMRLNSSPGG